MKTQNYYRTLCVEPDASGEEIKSAYRKLAQRFHPDVSDDPDSEGKFKAIGEAYRTLKLPETRLAYDRRILPSYDRDTFTPPFDTPFNVEDVWQANPLGAWYALFPWPDWGCFWAK